MKLGADAMTVEYVAEQRVDMTREMKIIFQRKNVIE